MPNNIKHVPKIKIDDTFHNDQYVELLISNQGIGSGKKNVDEGELIAETLRALQKIKYLNPKCVYIHVAAGNLARWNFWEIINSISDDELKVLLADIPDNIGKNEFVNFMAEKLSQFAEKIGTKYIEGIQTYLEKNASKIKLPFEIKAWSTRENNLNYNKDLPIKISTEESPEFSESVNKTRSNFLIKKDPLLIASAEKIVRCQPKLAHLPFHQITDAQQKFLIAELSCNQYIGEECKYYERVKNTRVIHKGKITPALDMVFTRCDLLVISKLPDDLDTLPMKSNSAYIRYENQLIYFNKETKELNKILISDEKLVRFDSAMKISQLPLNQPKSLQKKEVELIKSLTHHTHISDINWCSVDIKRRKKDKLREERNRDRENTLSEPKKPEKASPMEIDSPIPVNFNPIPTVSRRLSNTFFDEQSTHRSLASRRLKHFSALQFEQPTESALPIADNKEIEDYLSKLTPEPIIDSQKEKENEKEKEKITSLWKFFYLFNKTPPSPEKEGVLAEAISQLQKIQQ